MKKVYLFFTLLLCSSVTFPQFTSQEEQNYLEANGNTVGVQIFDQIDATTWDVIDPAPNPYGRVTAGVIGNYLYVFASQTTTTMAAAYNIITKQWVSSTQATTTAFNVGACVVNGELYRVGTVFEKFTPAGDGTGTWTVMPAAPTQIRGAENSLAWDGANYVYANGGTTTNYFYRYNISAGTWEDLLSVLPVPNRRYAGMIYHNGFIYRIGGLGETGWDGTLCHKYETATNTWSAIAPLPEPVNFTKWSTATDGEDIYLVGSGGGFSPYTISNKVFMYDISANTWTEESLTPAARGLALGIFLTPEMKMFFGGGNDGTGGSAYQSTNWEGTGAYTPVELTSFTAEAAASGIQLKWVTASENNNKGFAVERSADKTSWKEIAFISGSGTTIETTEYSYTDQDISNGKYFYRLRQIDFNGSVEYSTIIEADFAAVNSYALSQNYPNPFNPVTTISYTIAERGNVTLVVYDILGNQQSVLENSVKEAGTYKITYNASSLSSGVYFYKLTSGSFSEIKKFTLLK